MIAVHQLAANLAAYVRPIHTFAKDKKISRMDRCRTHRCPAHSALRFSWAVGLLAEEVA